MTTMYWCPCCFAGSDAIEAAETAGADVDSEEWTCDDCLGHMARARGLKFDAEGAPP